MLLYELTETKVKVQQQLIVNIGLIFDSLRSNGLLCINYYYIDYFYMRADWLKPIHVVSSQIVMYNRKPKPRSYQLC